MLLIFSSRGCSAALVRFLTIPSSENQPSTLTCPSKGSFLQDRSCWRGRRQHQSQNLRLAG